MTREPAARRVRAALRAAVVAGAVAAPLLTWASLDAGREQRLDALAQARTEEAASTLERDLRLRLAAIERWARRWERVGVPGREEFDAEAGDLIRDMPGFRALSYNDPGSIARYVVPSANSRALGRNIAEVSPDRRRALEVARDERRVTFTTPIQLVDGSGAGFIIFTPVHDAAGFRGTIGIVFHLATWTRHVLFEDTATPFAPGFEVRVGLDGTTLLATQGFEASPATIFASEPREVAGHALTAELRPTTHFAAANWSWRPEIVTTLVTLISALTLTLLVYVRRLDAAGRRSLEAEARLRRANRRLSGEVEVRTRAEAAARDAEAAMSRFLATVSHEVRTPLNAIMGLFELIARADLPERQRRQAESGVRAARGLFEQLVDVGDACRLDAAALEPRFERIPLGRLVEAWRSSLEARVERAGRPVRARLTVAEAAPAEVALDPRRVTQIVENLLDNAVKFAERGEVRVMVGPGPDGPRDLVVRVADTGPGIPPDRLGTIFERFYQADAGTRADTGSGLGLAISRELAERMGGSLTASSDPGAGSTFTLHLPEAAATEAAASRAAA